LDQWQSHSALFSGNAPLLEALFDAYQADPGSVPPHWRAWFDALPSVADRSLAPPPQTMPGTSCDVRQVSVLQLINAHRFLGVRHADLDPLKRFPRPEVPELDPAHYGLTADDNGRSI